MKINHNIIAALIILTPSPALTCECIHPQSLKDSGWSYAFKGEVISVKRTEDNGIVEEIVTFNVIRNITDVKSKIQRVLFRKGVEPCDIIEPKFKASEIYTITAMRNIQTNLLYNNYCNLRLKH